MQVPKNGVDFNNNETVLPPSPQNVSVKPDTTFGCSDTTCYSSKHKKFRKNFKSRGTIAASGENFSEVASDKDKSKAVLETVKVLPIKKRRNFQSGDSNETQSDLNNDEIKSEFERRVIVENDCVGKYDRISQLEIADDRSESIRCKSKSANSSSSHLWGCDRLKDASFFNGETIGCVSKCKVERFESYRSEKHNDRSSVSFSSAVKLEPTQVEHAFQWTKGKNYNQPFSEGCDFYKMRKKIKRSIMGGKSSEKRKRGLFCTAHAQDQPLENRKLYFSGNDSELASDWLIEHSHQALNLTSEANFSTNSKKKSLITTHQGSNLQFSNVDNFQSYQPRKRWSYRRSRDKVKHALRTKDSHPSCASGPSMAEGPPSPPSPPLLETPSTHPQVPTPSHPSLLPPHPLIGRLSLVDGSSGGFQHLPSPAGPARPSHPLPRQTVAAPGAGLPHLPGAPGPPPRPQHPLPSGVVTTSARGSPPQTNPRQSRPNLYMRPGTDQHQDPGQTTAGPSGLSSQEPHLASNSFPQEIITAQAATSQGPETHHNSNIPPNTVYLQDYGQQPIEGATQSPHHNPRLPRIPYNVPPSAGLQQLQNLSLPRLPPSDPRVTPQGARPLPDLHPSLTGQPLLPGHIPKPGPAPTRRQAPAVTPLQLEIQAAVQPDEDGDLALHIAAAQENIPMVQRFLDLMQRASISVDTTNNLRQSALHVAVIAGSRPVVEALVRAGASPDLRDRHGNSAVHLAVSYGEPPCLTALLRANTRPDWDMKNYDGLCPVHLAIEAGRVEMLTCLLDLGCDVNAQEGKGGRAPLSIAAQLHHPDMVDLLLARGANVNSQNYSGTTALHIASSSGDCEIAAKLVRFGADTTVKNSNFDTPLSLAKNQQTAKAIRTAVYDTDSSQQSSRHKRQRTH